MKRTLLILLLVIAMLASFCGCSAPAQSTTATPDATATTEPDATATTEPVTSSPKASPTYKETMLPFDQLVPGSRIIMLQNTLNYSRDGFYTENTKPVTQEISYKETAVQAYPIKYTLDFLTNGLGSTVTVTNTDGTTTELSAEDFSKMFVIVDFMSDTPPVLYDPNSGTEVTDFLFALTDKGEAIYSVVGGTTYNAAELIASVVWDKDATYRYVATDKFYIPVGPAENSTGEIRGTLSGAINGSFPDLTIASGKINDVIYIETIK
jgi:hypothetical protein